MNLLVKDNMDSTPATVQQQLEFSKKEKNKKKIRDNNLKKFVLEDGWSHDTLPDH